MSKAPLPIGVDEAVNPQMVATPLLPPASPRRGLAVTTASQSSTVNSASTGAALQHHHLHHPSADRNTLLPVLTSTFDCPPQDHAPRQQHQQQQPQQQQRLNAVRRGAPTTASSPSATLAPSSAAGPMQNAPTPAFSSVVVHPTPFEQTPSPSPYRGGFVTPANPSLAAAGATAAAAAVPNSVLTSTTSNTVAWHRQQSKPPMMNASLFTQGSNCEQAPSPTYSTGASDTMGSFSNATSPMRAGIVDNNNNATATTPAEPSRTNLILYNVAPHMTEEVLRGLFDVFGDVVSCAVMREIHTGESLGTAFVRFATSAEARRALSAFSDRTRPVLVNDSKPLVVQWARRRHDDAPVGEARKKIMKLFVRNIPLDCTVEMLEMLFGCYGGVRQVTLHKDTAPVENAAMERLIAFVIYTEEGAAERASNAVHNTKPFPSCNGIPVMIKLAESSQRRRFLRNADGTTTSAATSPNASSAANSSVVVGVLPHAQSAVVGSSIPFGTSGSGTALTANFCNIPSPHRAHAGTDAPLAPPPQWVPHAHAHAPHQYQLVQQQRSSSSPPAGTAMLNVQHLSYNTGVFSDAFPSSYQLSTMETPSLYTRADGTEATALTAGDYGMTEVFPYPSTSQMGESGTGVTTLYGMPHGTTTNSTAAAAARLGPQRSASYTHLPTHSGQLQHSIPYDYEDMMSVESLSRGVSCSAGRGGGSISGNGGGGYTSVGSHSQSRNHTANSLDASLTGYGTDRGSLSSKSTTASVAESAHGGGLNGNGGGSQAAFAGVRGASSSSKSWFSANDSSANTSVHAAMAGYPFASTGVAAPRGMSYGMTSSAMAGDGSVGSNGAVLHHSPCVPSAPSFQGRTRASLPAPAIVPTSMGGGEMSNNNSGNTASNTGASGDRSAGVQYLLFPGKAYLGGSNAASASTTAGNTCTHLNTPAKTTTLVASGSTSGNTLVTTSNDNSTSSCAVVQPNVEASVNWRRAVLTHTQHRRQPDGDAGLVAIAASGVSGGEGGGSSSSNNNNSRSNVLATPAGTLVAPPQMNPAHFTIPVCVSDAIPVVPRASPPKSPSVSVNPRRASASAGTGAQSSSPLSTVNSAARSGSTAAGTSAVPPPPGPTHARYYNNPYSPDSPKLYC